MSHQEKQEIFDRYANKRISRDWHHYLSWMIFEMKYTPEQVTQRIMEACDKVQEEQQKRIAEKSLVRYDYNELNKTLAGVSQKHFIGEGVRHYTVDKDSILNPENLIK